MGDKLSLVLSGLMDRAGGAVSAFTAGRLRSLGSRKGAWVAAAGRITLAMGMTGMVITGAGVGDIWTTGTCPIGDILAGEVLVTVHVTVVAATCG